MSSRRLILGLLPMAGIFAGFAVLLFYAAEHRSGDPSLYLVETGDGIEFLGGGLWGSQYVDDLVRQAEADLGRPPLRGPLRIRYTDGRYGFGVAARHNGQVLLEAGSERSVSLLIQVRLGYRRIVHETGQPLKSYASFDTLPVPPRAGELRQREQLAHIDSHEEMTRILEALADYVQSERSLQLQPLADLIRAGGGNERTHKPEGWIALSAAIAAALAMAIVPIVLFSRAVARREQQWIEDGDDPEDELSQQQ